MMMMKQECSPILNLRPKTACGPHVEVLRVRPEHRLRLEQLPLHPRDPLERMLGAQALEEQLPTRFSRSSPVKVIR